jgi:hypothetical protein
MKKMYEYLIEQRKFVFQGVKKRVLALKEDMISLAYKKCSREMESFSRSFRGFKRGQDAKELFAFDHSYLDEHCRDLLDRLEGRIPLEGEVPDFDPLKLRNLYLAIRKCGKYISLIPLLEACKAQDFTSAECAFIEAVVDMEIFPEFIEIIPFFERIAPDHPEITDPVPEPVVVETEEKEKVEEVRPDSAFPNEDLIPMGEDDIMPLPVEERTPLGRERSFSGNEKTVSGRERSRKSGRSIGSPVEEKRPSSRQKRVTEGV